MIIDAWVSASQSASPPKIVIASVPEFVRLAVAAKPVLEITEFGDVRSCFLDSRAAGWFTE